MSDAPCKECGEEARPGSNYCCEGCAVEGAYLIGRADERAAAAVVDGHFEEAAPAELSWRTELSSQIRAAKRERHISMVLDRVIDAVLTLAAAVERIEKATTGGAV